MTILPTITLFYGSIPSLMASTLGFGAESIRGKHGIPIGDGGPTGAWPWDDMAISLNGHP